MQGSTIVCPRTASISLTTPSSKAGTAAGESLKDKGEAKAGHVFPGINYTLGTFLIKSELDNARKLGAGILNTVSPTKRRDSDV